MNSKLKRFLICIILITILSLHGLRDLCIVYAKTQTYSGMTEGLENSVNSISFQQGENKISFILEGNWDSGHNVTVIVDNESEANTLENWQLEFDYPVSIRYLYARGF